MGLKFFGFNIIIEVRVIKDGEKENLGINETFSSKVTPIKFMFSSQN